MTARLALVPPPTVPAPIWHNAIVVDVHDGDTLRVLVDRGDDDLSEWTIRVKGAAARELADPGGLPARTSLARRLPHGAPVVLAGLGDDKYGGRHLARVFYAREGVVVDLAEQLVLDGWAAPWNGKGEQPKPSWPRRPARVEQPLAA